MMRWSNILPAVALLTAMSGAAIAGAIGGEGRTIILFGADWCAPCVAELRELPDLARAAAPDRLVLAWTDRDVRIPPSAAELNVTQVSRARARELMARYGSGNAGLPFVVMIESDGTRCAMLRRRLTGERIAVLRRSCDGKS